MYVLVTVAQTSHLHFLHCLEPIHLSKGKNLALTKYLLILCVLLNETMGPGENTALVSWLVYKIFKLPLIITTNGTPLETLELLLPFPKIQLSSSLHQSCCLDNLF